MNSCFSGYFITLSIQNKKDEKYRKLNCKEIRWRIVLKSKDFKCNDIVCGTEPYNLLPAIIASGTSQTLTQQPNWNYTSKSTGQGFHIDLLARRTFRQRKLIQVFCVGAQTNQTILVNSS